MRVFACGVQKHWRGAESRAKALVQAPMLRSLTSLGAVVSLASLATLVSFGVACGTSSSSGSPGTPGDAPDGGDPTSEGGSTSPSWNGAFDALDELATEQNAPRRIVTDAANVYWVGGPAGVNGTRGSFGYLRSVAKTGGGATAQTLAKDLPYPLALALADDGLYFTAYDLNANDGWSTGLRRVAPTGGAAEIVHLVPTASDPFGACSDWGPTELLADHAELLAGYDACGFDLKSTPARDVTPQAGSQGETLHAFRSRYALSATAVYGWRIPHAELDGPVARRRRPCSWSGTPKTIATVPSDQTGSNAEAEVERDTIVATTDYVYAAVSKPGIPQVSGEVGQLLRIAIASGKIEVVASFESPQLRVTGIAVDDRNVYFTVSTGLLLTCAAKDCALYAAPLDGSAKPAVMPRISVVRGRWRSTTTASTSPRWGSMRRSPRRATADCFV